MLLEVTLANVIFKNLDVNLVDIGENNQFLAYIICKTRICVVQIPQGKISFQQCSMVIIIHIF